MRHPRVNIRIIILNNESRPDFTSNTDIQESKRSQNRSRYFKQKNKYSHASNRNMSMNKKPRLNTEKRQNAKNKKPRKSDWYNHLMRKLDSQIKDLRKLIKK